MSEDNSDMGKQDRKDAILRFLHETGLVLPPKVLWVNLRREGATFSESTVHRHLAEMLKEGLVEQPLEDEGYYAVSEKGRKYLAGELDASELED